MHKLRSRKRTVVLMLVIVCLSLPWILTSCQSPSKTLHTEDPSQTDEPSLSTNAIREEPPSVAPTTPEPEIIHDNPFSGNLTYEDQIDYYYYTAPLTGKYRFTLDTNDVTTSYYLYIFSAKNEQLASASYDSDEHGRTVSLTQGEQYRLEVRQNQGFVQYKIAIGVPNAIQEVSGKVIQGKFHYIDQEDVYTYRAPETGVYRFDLDASDVTTSYGFGIFTEKNEQLKKDYFNTISHGVTVELNAGQVYTFIVFQSEQLPAYSIRIGTPKKVEAVAGSHVHGLLAYLDQQDVYTYTPPYSGTYQICFSIDQADSDYRVRLFNEKKETVANTSYRTYEHRETCKLQKGHTYRVEIEQSNGFPTYDIDFVYQGTSGNS